MKTALCLAALALLTIAAYSNTLHVPFVFDDYTTILGNPAVRSNTVAPIIWNRALLFETFALNWKFGKDRVEGYHAVNLALHIVNGALVFFVVRRVLA